MFLERQNCVLILSHPLVATFLAQLSLVDFPYSFLIALLSV